MTLLPTQKERLPANHQSIEHQQSVPALREIVVSGTGLTASHWLVAAPIGTRDSVAPANQWRAKMSAGRLNWLGAGGAWVRHSLGRYGALCEAGGWIISLEGIVMWCVNGICRWFGDCRKWHGAWMCRERKLSEFDGCRL